MRAPASDPPERRESPWPDRSYTIKEGKLEDFRRFLQELFTVLETNVPGLLAINAYLNEDGTEAAIVQVHKDADSMKHYWKVVHQHTGREISQFVDATTSTDVYGDPSDVVPERTRHSAEPGTRLSVKPEYLGGFTRLPAAPASPAPTVRGDARG
ncbi:MAG: hypothetical protein H0X16_07265 [Chloroflexi bacterium]|nr:hypothetical protein [Chloroflexota bacterium]